MSASFQTSIESVSTHLAANNELQHVTDRGKSLRSHIITVPYQFDNEQDRDPKLVDMNPRLYARPMLPSKTGSVLLTRNYLTQVLRWEFHHRGLKCEPEYLRAVNECSLTPYRMRQLVILGAGGHEQPNRGKSTHGGDKFGVKQLESVLVWDGFTNSKSLMPAACLIRSAVVEHIEQDVMKEFKAELEVKRAQQQQQAEAEGRARDRLGSLYTPFKKVQQFVAEKIRRHFF